MANFEVVVGGPPPIPLLAAISVQEAWCAVGLVTLSAVFAYGVTGDESVFLLPILLVVLFAANSNGSNNLPPA